MRSSSAPFSVVGGRGLPRQRQGVGRKGVGPERRGRSSHPEATPEKVARIWAEEWSKEGWQIDWQRLLPRRGFEVLPRRWVVERTFAWLSHNRRMSKDYEKLCSTSESFVYAAMARLMMKRLARV